MAVCGCATAGGSIGNPESVELNQKELTLETGKTFQLKSKLKSEKLKVIKHRNVVFESDNPRVAAVKNSGTIEAVGEGTCYVYAYAQNGVFARCRVTVQ